jgi:hypothetical protein
MRFNQYIRTPLESMNAALALLAILHTSLALDIHSLLTIKCCNASPKAQQPHREVKNVTETISEQPRSGTALH